MHTHVHVILNTYFQIWLSNTKRHQDNQKTHSGFAMDTSWDAGFVSFYKQTVNQLQIFQGSEYQPLK